MYKSLQMNGFEPQTSGVNSDHYTNWATTNALILFLKLLLYLLLLCCCCCYCSYCYFCCCNYCWCCCCCCYCSYCSFCCCNYYCCCCCCGYCSYFCFCCCNYCWWCCCSWGISNIQNLFLKFEASKMNHSILRSSHKFSPLRLLLLSVSTFVKINISLLIYYL